MNVANCKGCGRLFNALSSERLCPECRKRLDDKFQEVKEFLEKNPNSSIDTISKECNVSVKQLKQWVREERLTFSDDSLEGIECEQCGRMIKTGRFCDSCKSRISNNLMSAIDKPSPTTQQDSSRNRDTTNRMRYLQ